jgi:hypothetical protein
MLLNAGWAIFVECEDIRRTPYIKETDLEVLAVKQYSMKSSEVWKGWVSVNNLGNIGIQRVEVLLTSSQHNRFFTNSVT